FNFQHVDFRTDLRGAPDAAGLADVPWAGLTSEVNTAGELLAPGYVLDLENRGLVSLTFTAETYPGLAPLIDPSASFAALREVIYARYPQYRGLLDQGPQGLDDIFPGLTAIYEEARQHINPLEGIADEEVAFRFYIQASATVLTRDEFIARQTADALR